MALSTVRLDLHPAPLTRTILTAGSRVILADATNTPIAANPQGVNHLPASILVVPLAAGGTLVWLDAAGTTNTLVVAANTAGSVPFVLPGTAQSIEAATTSAAFQLVVSWNSAP